jgi:hypothetical protein
LLNLTTPSAKDLAFHRDTQDIRKYASSLGSSKHNVVEGAKGYGWRGRLKSSPQYPPELGPLLLSISHVDLVRYSKCKHITPNSSHFETIQVYYCDWKYKYRHDAEKVCASMFSTIRNLEIVEEECLMCLKEEVSTRTMMQSHDNSQVHGHNTFQYSGHHQNRHQGQPHAQIQQHTQGKQSYLSRENY